MKIDETNFSSVVKSANSYADLCKQYLVSYNGQGCNFFKELIVKYNLSTSHWNSHVKQVKYPFIEKECPVCRNKFTTQLGNRDEKETCSRGCSNVYFSDKRHTEESNKKTSESIKKYLLSVGRPLLTKTEYVKGKKVIIPLLKIKCVICGVERTAIRKNQKCCSNKCAAVLKNRDPNYHINLKAGVQKAVKEGRHKGWKTRNILSYPEKFFIKVLNNNGIKFEPNKPFMTYFLDFGIGDKMIDLEIDGKQHKYPDRKESDAARDKTLVDNGWKVYRIEWNSINNDIGKKLMKEKIDKFLEFYKSV